MKKTIIRSAIIAILIIFSTVLTTGCGKSKVRTNIHDNDSKQTTEEFCESFFNDNNLPYQKLTMSDVDNTPDEYLFYINDGIVYRTLNDYCIVIVNRKNLSEADDKTGKNYCGENYSLFEGDNVDILKISAAGEYAVLSMPSTIPDYQNNAVIKAFMNYSTKSNN